MSAVASIDGRAPGAKYRGLITLSVMLASIMQALDTTIANVALPRIQGSLSATQDQMVWVLTSYIVAAAIMTPLSGWLAGQIGRKRVFLFSVAGFTVASALCGLAESLPQVVAARLLQGICGAALIPMSQAVLLDINPPERHAKAMAMWVMAISAGPILGPALGGWLTENYNWRWVFYINAPFGLLSFLGILAFMAETEPHKSRFDFFGFTALSAAIGAFQLLLDRGQQQDWFSSTEIWVECVVAGVALYLFVVHMLTTTKAPFVSPALFKDRNFLTGNVFIFIVGVVLFATLALLPPLLQGPMNYPVILTGLVMVPRGIGTLAATYLVGRLAGKIDTRVVIAIGFGLTALSLWQMTGFYLQMGSMSIVWSGVIQGVGIGLVYAPLGAIAFATLAPRFRDEGTAFFSLVRNLGSSVGISAVQTLLTRNSQTLHSQLGGQVTPFSDLLHLHAATSTPAGLAALNASVSAQAAMIAYNDDFKLMMLLALCAVPLVALLSRSRPGKDAGSGVME